MLIALDYDGTYTADTGLWDRFIDLARSRMHEVWIVTARYDTEPVRLGTMVDRIVYTGREAKRQFLRAKFDADPQIWIDDMPEFVLHGAAPRELSEAGRTGLWAGEP